MSYEDAMFKITCGGTKMRQMLHHCNERFRSSLVERDWYLVFREEIRTHESYIDGIAYVLDPIPMVCDVLAHI